MHCDGTTAHGVHDVAELDEQTPLTIAASCEAAGTSCDRSASPSK